MSFILAKLARARPLPVRPARVAAARAARGWPRIIAPNRAGGALAQLYLTGRLVEAPCARICLFQKFAPFVRPFPRRSAYMRPRPPPTHPPTHPAPKYLSQLIRRSLGPAGPARACPGAGGAPSGAKFDLARAGLILAPARRRLARARPFARPRVEIQENDGQLAAPLAHHRH